MVPESGPEHRCCYSFCHHAGLCLLLHLWFRLSGFFKMRPLAEDQAKVAGMTDKKLNDFYLERQAVLMKSEERRNNHRSSIALLPAASVEICAIPTW